MIPVQIPLPEGGPLVGEVLHAASPVGAVLIGSAMGVKRSYYGAFCQYLAEQGFTTLCFDYRGIGDSAGQPEALHGWGEVDLPAAAAFLRAATPGLPQLYVAHSVGGQLMGLLPPDTFRAALFVGSQSGYWGNWSGLPRLGMAALWHLGIPVVVPLAGRLPMRALGQGEDIPAPVALEWARWGRHPDYIGRYLSERGIAGHHAWRAPIRSIAITDDTYAPPETVAALGQLYDHAAFEVVRLAPQDVGLKAIGHFGFFRRAVGPALWPAVVAWLREHAEKP